MEISEIIKHAWEAVEKAGVPKEVQVPAFNAAIRLMTPVTSIGDNPAKILIKEVSQDSPPGDITEETFYALIIERTDVDKTNLEKLVHLDNNEPKLISNAMKGNLTTAESIRAIAQVLTVVRSLGLKQLGTPLKTIKSECLRLNRFDEKNFKKIIKSIENFTIITKDKVEQLSARPPAFATFPTVVDKLLGHKQEL